MTDWVEWTKRVHYTMKELAGGGAYMDRDMEGYHCAYCHSWFEESRLEVHEPNCPIIRARKFLQEWPVDG